MTTPTKEPSRRRKDKERAAPVAIEVREKAPALYSPTDELLHFQEIYDMNPLDRVHIIRSGVHARVVSYFAKSMDLSKEHVSKTLGLSITTVDRKAKTNARLTSEQSEPVVGMAKLIGQVHAVVQQSGNPEGFDAALWFAQWLDQPLPALGGSKPAEYMDTAEGRELLSRLIAHAQSAAFA